MDRLELLSGLSIPETTKMVLLVMDGLGGLTNTACGETELEHSLTPNLDELATVSELGQTIPIARGITPGSGPAHMALFGYEPLKYNIGRGVLSALGVDFDLQPTDLASRINFATIDENGLVTDRRAGRIPTEKCIELCNLIKAKVNIPDVEVFIMPEKDYRAVVVFRGPKFSDKISDTDSQKTGVAPLQSHPLPGHEECEGARKAAEVVNEFQKQAFEAIKNQHPANGLLMRGFAMRPAMPMFNDIYKFNSACIAIYPMYRGLARLVGMNMLPVPANIPDEFDCLKSNWNKFDFFFMHIKYTDSFGEDGNFAKKCAIIEQVDQLLPKILDLNPDVLVITGDHSTPCQMKSHSWHPVPYLLYSKKNRIKPGQDSFGEIACATGTLGTFPAVENMAQMMAYAGRLNKFGA